MRIDTTDDQITLAFRIRRLMAVLAVALALGGITALAPQDADARPRSERRVSQMCGSAGGSVHYNFIEPDAGWYEMTCSLPSGASFSCETSHGGPFGDFLTCR